MWFDSIYAIKDFVGPDYEVSHVPADARRCSAISTSAPRTSRSIDRRPQ